MFGDKTKTTDKIYSQRDVDSKVEEAVEKRETDLNHQHELEIQKLKAEQDIALREKDFQLKHFESETVKKLQGEVNDLKREKAVLETKNEMLDKLTDINADVVDVKDLVTKLIGKLPEIKIDSISVNQTSKSKE